MAAFHESYARTEQVELVYRSLPRSSKVLAGPARFVAELDGIKADGGVIR